jgi:hypothetical protein
MYVRRVPTKRGSKSGNNLTKVEPEGRGPPRQAAENLVVTPEFGVMGLRQMLGQAPSRGRRGQCPIQLAAQMPGPDAAPMLGAVNYHTGETVVLCRRHKRQLEVAELLQALVNRHPRPGRRCPLARPAVHYGRGLEL